MKQPVPPSTRTVLPRPGGTSPVVFALGTSRSRFGPLVAGNGFSGRLVRLIPLLAMALVLALMTPDATGAAPFSDPDATLALSRFYRLRTP